MANINRPRGFRPINADGSPWSGQARTYYIAAGYGTALYKGDLVVLGGSSDSTGAYATIQQAAAGSTPVGVIVGFRPTYTDLSIHSYSAASTEGWALVCDDPSVFLKGQADGTMASTDVGLNVNITVGTADSTLQMSGMEIDETSAATTQGLPLSIVGIHNRPDNELGADQDVVVRFNMHQYRGAYAVIDSDDTLDSVGQQGV